MFTNNFLIFFSPEIEYIFKLLLRYVNFVIIYAGLGFSFFIFF